jgi:hypothetical protein
MANVQLFRNTYATCKNVQGKSYTHTAGIICVRIYETKLRQVKFVRAKRSEKHILGQCDWSAKKSQRKSWISSYFLTVRANKFAYSGKWALATQESESIAQET